MEVKKNLYHFQRTNKTGFVISLKNKDQEKVNV